MKMKTKTNQIKVKILLKSQSNFVKVQLES